MLLVLIALHLHIRRTEGVGSGLTKSSLWALLLVLSQIASGALLTSTLGNADMYLFANLLHNLIICGLFGVLADMSFRSWNLRERRI
jgi:cytochrome c oxidase assembly protein subunit 15